ncbi:hypothetical protein TRFO_06715 [Tritrichomonas foetus]|uniref:Leucine Rich Repeat family protein n=1 Tax=Tritrichomonas foetus TaxID=1144522 RepID=A0A1J4JWS9_9EUKA|nr:hypothetical protein TRFO_06715 [Tritrichomonas foetus]|eukprot:OHT03459.1 hypothetical protein TRFO_06715 [Tritrichomonas foetus]
MRPLSKSKILEVEPLCLRATGEKITEIDVLKPFLTQALKLYVSNNSIRTIETIGQFKSLEVLLISYNLITYIEDLYPLSALDKLTVLNIEGNPVCHLPLYSIHILILCPKLKELDGKKVGDLIYKKKYSEDDLLDILDSENSLLHAIMIADIINENLLSVPARSIESIDELLAERYPPNLVKERYNVIRKRCRDMKTFDYLSKLRTILIQKHQRIYDRALKNNFPPEECLAHKEVIDSLPGLDDLNLLMDDIERINQIACSYVESSTPINVDRRSMRTRTRRADQLSIDGDEIGNEIVEDLYKQRNQEEEEEMEKNKLNENDKANDNENGKGNDSDNKKGNDNENEMNFVDPNDPIVQFSLEEEEILEENQSIEIPKECLIQFTSNQIFKLFSIWKLKYKKLRSEKSPSASLIELNTQLETITNECETLQKQCDSIQMISNQSPIKSATDNRQLMRKVEAQKEYNETIKARLTQFQNEYEETSCFYSTLA